MSERTASDIMHQVVSGCTPGDLTRKELASALILALHRVALLLDDVNDSIRDLPTNLNGGCCPPGSYCSNCEDLKP